MFNCVQYYVLIVLFGIVSLIIMSYDIVKDYAESI